MVAGAFAGWLTVYAGGSLWLGVLVAALTGAAFGLLHAWLTVGLALSQHVAGLGITMLATALSYYGYRVSFPKVNTPPTVTRLPMQPIDVAYVYPNCGLGVNSGTLAMIRRLRTGLGLPADVLIGGEEDRLEDRQLAVLGDQPARQRVRCERAHRARFARRRGL